MQYSLEERLEALRNNVLLPNLPEDNRSLDEMRRDVFINDYNRNDNVSTYPLEKPVIFQSINTSSNAQIIHDKKVYSGAQTILNGSIVDRLNYLSRPESQLSFAQKEEGGEFLSHEIRENDRQQNAALQNMLRQI